MEWGGRPVSVRYAEGGALFDGGSGAGEEEEGEERRIEEEGGLGNGGHVHGVGVTEEPESSTLTG